MNILAEIRRFIHADIKLAKYGTDEVMGKLIDEIYLKPLKKENNEEKYKEFEELKEYKWDKWVQKSAHKFERNFNNRIPAEDFIEEFIVFMLSSRMKKILKEVDSTKKEPEDVLKLFNTVLSTKMLKFGQTRIKHNEMSIDEDRREDKDRDRGKSKNIKDRLTDKSNPKELNIDEKDVVNYIKKEIPKFLKKHKEKRTIGSPTLIDLYDVLLKSVKGGGNYAKAIRESYKKWVGEGVPKSTLHGKWVVLKGLLLDFFKKEEKSTGIPPNLFKKMLKISSRVYVTSYVRKISKWMLACGDCECGKNEEEGEDAII